MKDVKPIDKKVYILKAFLVDLLSVRAGAYIRQNTTATKEKG